MGWFRSLFSSSTADATSLSERVRGTRSLPAIWETVGPSGSFTQLDGDVRHWLKYRGLGMRWNEYGKMYGTVAQRIMVQYPQWILWATRQMVLASGGGTGDYATALVNFKRFHGEPSQLVNAEVVKFFSDWEVAPIRYE